MREHLQHARRLLIIFYAVIFINPVYSTSSNVQEKIEDYKSELARYSSSGEERKVAEYLNKLGYEYWQIDALGEAAQYFEKSIEVNSKIGNNNALRVVYNNLGLIYSQKEEYQIAISYFEKSLNMNQKLNKPDEVASDYLNLALALQALTYYAESNIKAQKSLEKSLEINNLRMAKSCYSLIAENYEKLGESKLAAENYEKYSSISKHLQKEEMNQLEDKSKALEAQAIKKEKELQTAKSDLGEITEEKREVLLQNELFKKENELKDRAFKEEQQRREAEGKLRRTQFIMFTTALVLFLFVMLLVYRQFRHKKLANIQLQDQNLKIEKQKEELEKQRDLANKQKKKITDSIQYARRIQTAVMPPEGILAESLKDCFILYRPKDIVSGDFYWLSKKDNALIVAAADCTGHGVPGAFMSMLGIAYLNEIVNKIAINKHIKALNTDEILNQLRDMVIASLRQTGHRDEPKDGMDISICIIDFENKRLQFSGANNPLYIIRKGNLIQLQADKMPVSYHQRKDTAFSRAEIDLLQDDCIYMFSDGYLDQFGGEKGMKFMRKRFQQLLLEICDQPMDLQREKLETTIDQWRGEWTQLDDILVMGMRFSSTTVGSQTLVREEWPGKTILIAEDTDINYFLLAEALKDSKATLVRVKDGREAVDFIKSNEVDLILMDINMPNMDGYEATRAIKKYKSNIPIIVQTAMHFDEEITAAEEAGADDFISKPIDLKSFLKKISKHISKSHT